MYSVLCALDRRSALLISGTSTPQDIVPPSDIVSMIELSRSHARPHLQRPFAPDLASDLIPGFQSRTFLLGIDLTPSES